MNRREFLVRATIGGVTIPLLVTEIGCSEDDGNGGPGPNSETFGSSSANGHTHTITISDDDLTAGGPHSYTSSNVSSHTHQVDLTGPDVDALIDGCVVNTVSSNSDGHTHTWRILFAGFVTDVQSTSDLVSGHTHTMTVQAQDLSATSPPGTRNITTSFEAQHEHEVVLELADFQALQNCQSVSKQSSTVSGHFHSFVIQRV
jgi:hypothetical protein